LAEDNADMNRFVCDTLQQDYSVEAAFDGQEAYDRAHAQAPDLIVSDLMMPRVSGEELVRRVRETRELDAVPILLLTARADDALRAALLRGGAQDYLTKPFSPEELRARVGNLITMKRTRELLQRELASQTRDLEALAREATDRKRELQTAAESLSAARTYAERASAAKTDFLSLVTHELRTPLTSLMLQLELLLRDADFTPRQRGLLGKLAASSRRLAALVESVLEFSRVGGGRVGVRPEPIDMCGLAAEVLDEHRPLADDKRIHLELAAEGELPVLRSDPRLLRVVIGNLVGNALKFTESGRVEVACAVEGGRHVIRVSDTGPGISRDQRADIFEPFRHIEPLAGKRTTGVGLGLALVKEIMAALGGTVDVASESGSGSTFIVRIPSSSEPELEHPGR
jgi:signal transduction histidine kinase